MKEGDYEMSSFSDERNYVATQNYVQNKYNFHKGKKVI